MRVLLVTLAWMAFWVLILTLWGCAKPVYVCQPARTSEGQLVVVCAPLEQARE